MSKFLYFSLFTFYFLLFTFSLPLAGADLPETKRDVLTVNNRPPVEERLFRSEAVEEKIKEVASQLTNLRLAWMFVNCFPNTLDTTVHFDEQGDDGLPDTFVYTGDIHAMWLRDSGAQVFPYVRLAPQDRHLQQMLKGVILRQLKCICLDPYANAFNREPNPNGSWMKDLTRMTPMLHERKWEVDSPCYVLRLAYEYWKQTADESVFGDLWIEAVHKILTTFRDQQRKQGKGQYQFQRRTERQLDTMNNDGWGAPVRPVGLIASAFRPSDDATTLLFLVIPTHKVAHQGGCLFGRGVSKDVAIACAHRVWARLVASGMDGEGGVNSSWQLTSHLIVLAQQRLMELTNEGLGERIVGHASLLLHHLHSYVGSFHLLQVAHLGIAHHMPEE